MRVYDASNKPETPPPEGDGVGEAIRLRRCQTRVASMMLNGECVGMTRIFNRAPALIQTCETLITKAVAYSREHLADLPEISNWTWTDG